MNKLINLSIILLMSVALFSCKTRKKTQEKAYMEKTYALLKQKLPSAKVTKVDDSIKVIFPNNVLFETNKSEISPSVLGDFEKFAYVLNKFNKTSILVNGYTDNTGNHEINAKLSNERAQKSKQVLINFKVKPVRLYAWGHGANNPVASNDTEEGRQLNRRVEFLVLYEYN